MVGVSLNNMCMYACFPRVRESKKRFELRRPTIILKHMAPDAKGLLAKGAIEVGEERFIIPPPTHAVVGLQPSDVAEPCLLGARVFEIISRAMRRQSFGESGDCDHSRAIVVDERSIVDGHTG